MKRKKNSLLLLSGGYRLKTHEFSASLIYYSLCSASIFSLASSRECICVCSAHKNFLHFFLFAVFLLYFCYNFFFVYSFLFSNKFNRTNTKLFLIVSSFRFKITLFSFSILFSYCMRSVYVYGYVTNRKKINLILIS